MGKCPYDVSMHDGGGRDSAEALTELIQHRTVQLGTRARPVLESGRGDRAVLFLHGFPDDATCWGPVLERIAARGFRCLAPFMPGYRETPAVKRGDYRPSSLGRQTLEVMDALGLQRVALVGHDWGAVAAYACTALAPERIERLAILGLPPLPVLIRNMLRRPAHLNRMRHLLYLQLPVFARWWLARRDFSGIEMLWQRWSPGWEIPAEHLAAVKATFRTPGTIASALTYYRHAQSTALLRPRGAFDTFRLLFARIAVPTLLLAGARDGGISPVMFAGYERHFDGPVSFETIPGAGHFFPRERPDAVAALLARFLET